MYKNQWSMVKSEAIAANGMVATKHPFASQVGVDILRQGGNAIDAAVASAFAVGVVEPWMNGLGGGGFLVYHSTKGGGRSRVFDFSVRSAQAAQPDMYPLGGETSSEMFGWRPVDSNLNVIGYQSIAVPGTPAGLALALAEEGTMSLEQVLQPSIKLAREGFPVDWFTMLQIAADAVNVSRFPETAKIFFDQGFPRTPGSGSDRPLLKQPELAVTLETLATEGVEAFYRGRIASKIVRAMRENGGLITAEDLATYEPIITETGHAIKYHNFNLVTSTKNSGGPAVAATLQGLELSNKTAFRNFGHNSVAALHAFAEAAGNVFNDRLASQLSIAVNNADSEAATAGMPVTSPIGGSTTHLSVIDRDRNMVSLTQTLLSRFGSRVTIPETGILMNNGMLWFNPEPGHPDSVRGGVRPLTNMSPLLWLDEDRQPFATLGSSGGRRIINAVAQISLNMIEYGMSIQEAINAPRIDLSTGVLLADSRLNPHTIEGLKKLGHEVVVAEESFLPLQFASPVGIQVDDESGTLRGGADPFHQARCIGW